MTTGRKEQVRETLQESRPRLGAECGRCEREALTGSWIKAILLDSIKIINQVNCAQNIAKET